MNTTLVAFPAGYDEFGCEVSLLRYHDGIIFWIHEKVEMEGEISNEIRRVVKNC
jgi:hypothetical protein